MYIQPTIEGTTFGIMKFPNAQFLWIYESILNCWRCSLVEEGFLKWPWCYLLLLLLFLCCATMLEAFEKQIAIHKLFLLRRAPGMMQYWLLGCSNMVTEHIQVFLMCWTLDLHCQRFLLGKCLISLSWVVFFCVACRRQHDKKPWVLKHECFLKAESLVNYRRFGHGQRFMKEMDGLKMLIVSWGWLKKNGFFPPNLLQKCLIYRSNFRMLEVWLTSQCVPGSIKSFCLPTPARGNDVVHISFKRNYTTVIQLSLKEFLLDMWNKCIKDVIAFHQVSWPYHLI